MKILRTGLMMVLSTLFVTLSMADDSLYAQVTPQSTNPHLMAQYADHACKVCRNNCVNARERENVGCCQAQGGKPQPSSCEGARNPNGYAQCLGQVHNREVACHQRCEPCGNTSNPNARLETPASALIAKLFSRDNSEGRK